MPCALGAAAREQPADTQGLAFAPLILNWSHQFLEMRQTVKRLIFLWILFRAFGDCRRRLASDSCAVANPIQPFG